MRYYKREFEKKKSEGIDRWEFYLNKIEGEINMYSLKMREVFDPAKKMEDQPEFMKIRAHHKLLKGIRKKMR